MGCWRLGSCYWLPNCRKLAHLKKYLHLQNTISAAYQNWKKLKLFFSTFEVLVAGSSTHCLEYNATFLWQKRFFILTHWSYMSLYLFPECPQVHKYFVCQTEEVILTRYSPSQPVTSHFVWIVCEKMRTVGVGRGSSLYD